jgi:phage terminase large subunit-like protein
LDYEQWERDFLDELFLVYDDGSRVYKEALLGVARKNGKSTLTASLGLYLLLGAGEQGPEVYAAAASKDQARIVFDQARDFIDASPRLRDWLQPQRSAIVCKANGGVFRVLSSDAPLQYGLNPFGVIIDELWAHKNPELYYALTTGQLAREDAMVISITTAGWDRESICHQQYRRGKKLLEAGGLDAMRKAGFFFRWYEPEPGSDYRDKKAWKAANPSSWINLQDLEREADRLPESVFRRLHLNQWTESEDAWIKPHEWDKLRGEVLFDPDKTTYVGVDVGIRRDSAAIVWGQWHDEVLHVGQIILSPEEEGNEFGVADVRAALAARTGSLGNVEEIAYDPWSFRESAEILRERGLPMVEFPQNASRMAPASENLYELVTENRLMHDGNDRMRDHILAAVIAPTDRGGWRLSKRKSLEKIDGAVALAMMADSAVTLRYVKPSVYETRGVLSIAPPHLQSLELNRPRMVDGEEI